MVQRQQGVGKRGQRPDKTVSSRDAAIRAYTDVLAASLDQVVAPSYRRHLHDMSNGALFMRSYLAYMRIQFA